MRFIHASSIKELIMNYTTLKPAMPMYLFSNYQLMKIAL